MDIGQVLFLRVYGPVHKHAKRELGTCGTKPVSVLPARVANHSARFGSPCPSRTYVVT